MKQLYATPYRGDAYREASVLVWIEHTITVGRPPSDWDDELRQAVTARQEAGPATRPFKTSGYWKLRGAWDQGYRALLAPPGESELEGRTAIDDLRRPPAPGISVRWIELVDGDGETVGTLASFVSSEGLEVFDPRSAHWEVPIEGSDQWFSRLMREHYTETIVEFRAHVVVVPTPVHFTWIGPPAPTPAQVGMTDLFVRRDVVGPERIAAAALAPDTPSLQFHFHCMRTHAAQFRQQLPPAVRVVAVQDQLATTQQYAGLMLTRPPLDDLELCVDYIVRTSVAIGDGRNLVNAKNVWSMYCLWRNGGYHLDTGVIPLDDDAPTVSFPWPTDFVLPDVSLQGRGPLRRANLTFGAYAGADVDSLIRDESHVFFRRVLPDQEHAGDVVELRGAQVDVWMMGSPQGDPHVRRALEFYIRAWFKIHSMVGQLGNLSRAAYRAAVISAALTGAAPSDERFNARWPVDVLTDHLIAANLGRVPLMGLRKLGFQSHV